jgi:hypothetical protein
VQVFDFSVSYAARMKGAFQPFFHHKSAGSPQEIHNLLHKLSAGNPQKIRIFSTRFAQLFRAWFESISRVVFPQAFRRESEAFGGLGRKEKGRNCGGEGVPAENRALRVDAPPACLPGPAQCSKPWAVGRATRRAQGM